MPSGWKTRLEDGCGRTESPPRLDSSRGCGRGLPARLTATAPFSPCPAGCIENQMAPRWVFFSILPCQSLFGCMCHRLFQVPDLVFSSLKGSWLFCFACSWSFRLRWRTETRPLFNSPAPRTVPDSWQNKIRVFAVVLPHPWSPGSWRGPAVLLRGP